MSAYTGSQGSAARRPGRRIPFLRSFYWLLISLLYLPIALLAVFSFSDGTTLAFPIEGFTLDWY
jgi:ABC-type spermidine/putrescine transport system permease subunit II